MWSNDYTDEDIEDEHDQDETTDEEVDADPPEADEEEQDAYEEEPSPVARADAFFRKNRTFVRACKDVRVLRKMRQEYVEYLDGDEIGDAWRIRLGDLVELIDDRVTDLFAARVVSGQRS